MQQFWGAFIRQDRLKIKTVNLCQWSAEIRTTPLAAEDSRGPQKNSRESLTSFAVMMAVSRTGDGLSESLFGALFD